MTKTTDPSAMLTVAPVDRCAHDGPLGVRVSVRRDEGFNLPTRRPRTTRVLSVTLACGACGALFRVVPEVVRVTSEGGVEFPVAEPTVA